MSRDSGKMVIVESKAGYEKLLVELDPRIAEIIPDERMRRRLKMLALVAASKLPLLYQCTKESLAYAIMTGAELGLDFSGALKQAYILPFKNGKTGQYEAVFVPGWRGLRDKALETGAQPGAIKITGFLAVAVRANDEYDFVDLDSATMRPMAFHRAATGERGELVAAYCAWQEDGVPQVCWLSQEQVLKRKACAHGTNRPDSPWNAWPDEQWAKTAARFAVDKRMPIAMVARAAIALAVSQEDAIIGGFIDMKAEEKEDAPPEGREPVAPSIE